MSVINTEIKLDRRDVSALETSFRGQLVRPGTPATTSTAGSGTARSTGPRH